MIQVWSEIPSAQRASLEKQLEEIFFLSSVKTQFSSPEEKKNFFHKWTEYYFQSEPQHIYLAIDDQGQLLGYLMGCVSSYGASEFYEKRNPGYALFQDLFDSYPAHLHINCHPRSRGQGAGKKLVEHFVKELALAKIPGLHIVTASGARNVQFYRNCGFDFEEQRLLNKVPLLFMGRKIRF
ncbi:MAG: GNAT family N-acetyltransferase [Bdellovibrionales bacterium]